VSRIGRAAPYASAPPAGASGTLRPLASSAVFLPPTGPTYDIAGASAAARSASYRDRPEIRSTAIIPPPGAGMPAIADATLSLTAR